jgi:hypothetical protein
MSVRTRPARVSNVAPRASSASRLHRRTDPVNGANTNLARTSPRFAPRVSRIARRRRQPRNPCLTATRPAAISQANTPPTTMKPSFSRTNARVMRPRRDRYHTRCRTRQRSRSVAQQSPRMGGGMYPGRAAHLPAHHAPRSLCRKGRRERRPQSLRRSIAEKSECWRRSHEDRVRTPMTMWTIRHARRISVITISIRVTPDSSVSSALSERCAAA